MATPYPELHPDYVWGYIINTSGPQLVFIDIFLRDSLLSYSPDQTMILAKHSIIVYTVKIMQYCTAWLQGNAEIWANHRIAAWRMPAQSYYLRLSSQLLPLLLAAFSLLFRNNYFRISSFCIWHLLKSALSPQSLKAQNKCIIVWGVVYVDWAWGWLMAIFPGQYIYHTCRLPISRFIISTAVW